MRTPLLRLVAFLSIPGATFAGCDPAADVVIAEPLEIDVTGSSYEWHVRYPGPDGVLGNGDDIRALGDLHVPVDTTVEIHLTSDDYIYGFRIPTLGVNKMAVPDLRFQATLRTGLVREHLLAGDQMCGFSHESLLRTVFVHERSAYRSWVHAQAKRAARPHSQEIQ